MTKREIELSRLKSLKDKYTTYYRHNPTRRNRILKVRYTTQYNNYKNKGK